MIQWIKNYLNRPPCYPRLIGKDEWYSQTLFNTNKPLFNDNGESYENYLLHYKEYKRDIKLTQLGL